MITTRHDHYSTEEPTQPLSPEHHGIPARDPRVDPRKLWSGGAASAGIAALTALVGVLVSRWLFNLPVLAPGQDDTYNHVNTTAMVLVAAAAALAATGLVHLLLATTPRPLLFFGWVVALVTALAVIYPFSTLAPLGAKMATAVVVLAIGTMIGTLVGGAAARSTVNAGSRAASGSRPDSNLLSRTDRAACRWYHCGRHHRCSGLGDVSELACRRENHKVQVMPDHQAGGESAVCRSARAVTGETEEGHALVTPRLDWRCAAACRGCDPELFFPVSSTGPAAEQQATGAKAVCARCPVRAECLDFALRTGQTHGVWGGMSEQERHLLREHNGRPADPGAGGRRRDRARADQPAAADGGTREPGTGLPAVS